MKKLLLTSSILAIITGIVMVAGGVWGVAFTHSNVIQEQITTPDDASIPNTLVRGPFTLKSQADVIRKHALRITGGQTYAQMPRQVPTWDTEGNLVVDENGETIMVANSARNTWITATTFTTALNLGIITYAFSALILFFGFVSFWTGVTFYVLSRKE
jgi:hypothetical protein